MARREDLLGPIQEVCALIRVFDSLRFSSHRDREVVADLALGMRWLVEVPPRRPLAQRLFKLSARLGELVFAQERGAFREMRKVGLEKVEFFDGTETVARIFVLLVRVRS